MKRHWEEGDPRGTIETIPFPGHRSMVEVLREEKRRATRIRNLKMKRAWEETSADAFK